MKYFEIMPCYEDIAEVRCENTEVLLATLCATIADLTYGKIILHSENFLNQFLSYDEVESNKFTGSIHHNGYAVQIQKYGINHLYVIVSKITSGKLVDRSRGRFSKNR